MSRSPTPVVVHPIVGMPTAGEMPVWVKDAVEGVAGVKSGAVNLTFEPPWDPSMMSDEAKLQLNMF